jgi:uncharacterized membrane protein YdbT with pleckstrin-like domain
VAGDDGLVEGEQEVLRLHPHARTMFWPAAYLLVIVAVTVTLLLVLPASTVSLLPVRAGIGIAALVAAAFWFGGPFLRWRTTTYEVTTRRLRLREGIIARSGRDFPLNRISDVSFSQSLLDRIFGSGKLIVESPGEHGQLTLTEIPDVKRVQSVLFELVGEETSRATGADRADT